METYVVNRVRTREVHELIRKQVEIIKDRNLVFDILKSPQVGGFTPVDVTDKYSVKYEPTVKEGEFVVTEFKIPRSFIHPEKKSYIYKFDPDLQVFEVPKNIYTPVFDVSTVFTPNSREQPEVISLLKMQIDSHQCKLRKGNIWNLLYTSLFISDGYFEKGKPNPLREFVAKLLIPYPTIPFRNKKHSIYWSSTSGLSILPSILQNIIVIVQRLCEGTIDHTEVLLYLDHYYTGVQDYFLDVVMAKRKIAKDVRTYFLSKLNEVSVPEWGLAGGIYKVRTETLHFYQAEITGMQKSIDERKVLCSPKYVQWLSYVRENKIHTVEDVIRYCSKVDFMSSTSTYLSSPVEISIVQNLPSQVNKAHVDGPKPIEFLYFDGSQLNYRYDTELSPYNPAVLRFIEHMDSLTHKYMSRIVPDSEYVYVLLSARSSGTPLRVLRSDHALNLTPEKNEYEKSLEKLSRRVKSASGTRILYAAINSNTYRDLMAFKTAVSRRINQGLRNQVDRQPRPIASETNERLLMSSAPGFSLKKYTEESENAATGKSTGTYLDMLYMLQATSIDVGNMVRACLSTDASKADSTIQGASLQLCFAISQYLSRDCKADMFGPMFKQAVTIIRKMFDPETMTHKVEESGYIEIDAIQLMIAYATEMTRLSPYKIATDIGASLATQPEILASGVAYTNSLHTVLFILRIYEALYHARGMNKNIIQQAEEFMNMSSRPRIEPNYKSRYNKPQYDLFSKPELEFLNPDVYVSGDDISISTFGKEDQMVELNQRIKDNLEINGYKIEAEMSSNTMEFLQQRANLGRYEGYAHRIILFLSEKPSQSDIIQFRGEIAALVDDLVYRVRNPEGLNVYRELMFEIAFSRQYFALPYGSTLNLAKLSGINAEIINLRGSKLLAFDLTPGFLWSEEGLGLPAPGIMRYDGSFTMPKSIFTPSGDVNRKTMVELIDMSKFYSFKGERINLNYTKAEKAILEYYGYQYVNWLVTVITAKGDSSLLRSEEENTLLVDLASNLRLLANDTAYASSAVAASLLMDRGYKIPDDINHSKKHLATIRRIVDDVKLNDNDVLNISKAVIEKIRRIAISPPPLKMSDSIFAILFIRTNTEAPESMERELLNQIDICNALRPGTTSCIIAQFMGLRKLDSPESSNLELYTRYDNASRIAKQNLTKEVNKILATDKSLWPLFQVAANISPVEALSYEKNFEFLRSVTSFTFNLQISPRRLFFQSTTASVLKPYISNYYNCYMKVLPFRISRQGEIVLLNAFMAEIMSYPNKYDPRYCYRAVLPDEVIYGAIKSMGDGLPPLRDNRLEVVRGMEKPQDTKDIESFGTDSDKVGT